MNVEQSYAHCERVAREQAKNFYVTFLLLSREQRRAMCAIYAFMRYCDDLSDDAGIANRAAAIAAWNKDLKATLAGHPPDNPIWPAFADAVARFKIPHQYFDDMITGVSSDLEARNVETFDDLYRYCYNVASVVGLTIVYIFGFESPKALELAEKCGIAFQLTNILRDVREDAENGRIYWPAEDLRRFGVSPKDLCGPALSPNLKNLLKFEAQRARAYYEESAPLVNLVHKGSQASMRALIGIYSRLLDRIEEEDYDVLSQRVRVATPEKLWILLRAKLS
ncbi:MAG: phytoene/squalene synthase family protein [Bryobacteraceae bacterium]